MEPHAFLPARCRFMEASPRLVEGVVPTPAAEAPPRLGERLVWRKAAPDELRDAFVDVEADLLVHLLSRQLVGAGRETEETAEASRTAHA